MICGTGIDIIRVQRIEKAMTKWGERFLAKIFSPQELTYARQKKNPAIHLAARFAAKEAFFKALGFGWAGGLRWVDVEVERSSTGQPELTLKGTARTMASARGVQSILLSLSHESEYAVAHVLLISNSKQEQKESKRHESGHC